MWLIDWLRDWVYHLWAPRQYYLTQHADSDSDDDISNYEQMYLSIPIEYTMFLR